MENVDHRTFIYRISAENQITYLNRDWIAFARQNQAPELVPEQLLGQDLDRYIVGEETKQLYEMIYERVRRTRREIQLPFRCDSPCQKRYFRMCIAPARAGELEFTVKVLRLELCPTGALLDNTAAHTGGFLVICSWCKRIQIDSRHWVEIEEAMKKRELFDPQPPSLTHGVCPDCFATIRRQLGDGP
jgi:hypothetical protein